LVRKIGEGGHSCVYLGMSRKSNEPVAVKVCRSGDPEIIINFINTFKTTKKLHHHLLLKCHEIYIEEDTETLYLVMEYSHYPTLENIHLSEPFIRSIIKSLLTVVAYIHSKGICHRDLKIDNILVQPP
jgi:serine/threonine protein kinase